MTLISQTSVELDDALAAIEHYFEQGWTDGLPVVPPTESAIRAMLAAAGLAPDAVLGEIAARGRRFVAEKVAINAVMAGCRPEYMPVVAAVVEALCDPAFSAHGPTTSTSGMGVLVIVNGPVAARLGINAGENLFGPGFRANATIGRAVRLILRNCFGTVPGVLDRSVFGHPGKFTYCIAENEAVSPWPPLAGERGVADGAGAVTLLACEGPHQVANQTARSGEEILASIADVMVGGGRLALSGQQFAVVIGQQHMAILDRDGLDKAAIRDRLRALACRSVADLKRVGRVPGPREDGDEDKVVHAVAESGDILVVAAGGAAGGYSVVCAGWAGRQHSMAVTHPIRRG